MTPQPLSNGTNTTDAVAAPPRRLNGWKEIAAYLNKSVRTVQRWERQFAMPVHRVQLKSADAVFAVPEELD